ncbi:tRNA:m(4)X modification enzyme TRM13 homolog [Echinops telfairi]|uniref:tRNA:m(4)X modification enzyme TRM13 homolog n=1 Tax=Echinops telfairi TaxID=9371 RepID=A0AC55D889_ECHTE|nr:tRNA:m(4)X modification enzyme TRM13 homolog [Echinops telfairi]
MAACAPTPPATGFPTEGRCGYYVGKKKRFCRMVVAAGKRFCGEHAGAAGPGAEVCFSSCPPGSRRAVGPGTPLFPAFRNASILGNIEKLKLLGPRRCFVEFGAGKGKLSHWVDIALKDAEKVHFILVEKVTTRFKVDGKHRKENSVFERLQIDIQHLCLNKVPLLIEEKLPVIGIGKHLCGMATDLALRCLVETYAASCEERNEEPLAKRIKNETAETETNTLAKEGNEKTVPEKWTPVAGIVIALCCHHRCEWRHYVGKEYFRALGLGAVEFHYFQRMSSWATCGMRKTSLEVSNRTTKSKDHENVGREEHDGDGHSVTEESTDGLPGFLTVGEKKRIGHLCKLLIDEGRVQYLEQKGFSPALQYYTDPLVSLENVLLTALPNHSSP